MSLNKFSYMVPEENLLAKIQQHDLNAFNILFDTYYMQLYCYCRKFVSETEAKDIVQNVYLRFWERKAYMNVQSSVKAYLYKSVKYEALNYLRSKKKQLQLEDDFFGNSYIGMTDIHSIPDVEMTYHEIELIVERVIDKLPDRCKTIFIESRINGMKNLEIAEKMNISVRTVDAHIYRALKILKLKLKDYLAV